MKKISVLIFVLIFSFFANASEQDSLKLQLENLFEVSKKVNTPESEKEKSRKEIEGAIDWEDRSFVFGGV